MMNRKLLLTPTLRDFNMLMDELRKDGYRWSSGTSLVTFRPWHDYGENTVVEVVLDKKYICYCFKGFFEEEWSHLPIEIYDLASNSVEDWTWRKKPICIEAFQWTGDVDQLGEPLWIVEALRRNLVHIEFDDYENPIMLIETKEGVMKAKQGDYIIKGIEGELYPCDSKIFLETYERPN